MIPLVQSFLCTNDSLVLSFSLFSLSLLLSLSLSLSLSLPFSLSATPLLVCASTSWGVHLGSLTFEIGSFCLGIGVGDVPVVGIFSLFGNFP